MKQLKEGEIHSPTCSNQQIKSSRNNRLKKKRQDRKKKLAGNKIDIMDQLDVSSSEERKQNRKMRNRDAAQRARDKAKKKMEQLIEENEVLKMENQILKKKMVVICLKCQTQGVVKQQQQQSSPSTSNVVSQNPCKIQPKPSNECRFQRVIGLPAFQYPFYFGLLTIIACFILILSNPHDDQYNMQMRILENIIENSWKRKQNSLTRQINQTMNREIQKLNEFSQKQYRRGQYEYYQRHIVYLKPKTVGKEKSSLIIEIEEQDHQQSKGRLHNHFEGLI